MSKKELQGMIREQLEKLVDCKPYNVRILPEACVKRKGLAMTGKEEILRWKKNPASGGILTKKILGLERCIECQGVKK